MLKEEPSTLHNLLMGVKTTWELCLFQVVPFISFQGLQMGYLFFGQKGTAAERVAMATPLRV